jgi:hypothetical protein
MAKKVTWKDVSNRIEAIRQELVRQNFLIDVTYLINQKLRDNLPEGRTNINTPAISAYWANEIYNHYLLNDFELKASNVYIDPPSYYSYLDLMEINENNAKSGESSNIVDIMIETTDVKEGEDLDDFLTQSSFADLAEELYVDANHDILVDSGLLEIRKNKVIRKEYYWKYANWMLMLRVMDPNFQTVVVFVMGAYSEYEN